MMKQVWGVQKQTVNDGVLLELGRTPLNFDANFDANFLSKTGNVLFTGMLMPRFWPLFGSQLALICPGLR